jgi:hypothetical protein
MLKHYAKKSKFAIVAFLGLVVLLLSGCASLAAGATQLQQTPTPSPPPTTGPPQEPPANIPVYPGAKLQLVQSASLDSNQATVWGYTVSGPDVTLADVARFYEREMPRNGWVQRESVPPENVQGTYGATVLVYHLREAQGTPTPMPHQHYGKQMAIIAAGVNSQANPHEIGFVITLVK